jgi:hypothetical protein
VNEDEADIEALRMLVGAMLIALLALALVLVFVRG